MKSGLPYVDPRAPHGAFYRAYVKVASTRPAQWLSRKVGWKLDPVLMRITRGRLGTGLMLPTAILETRGARSGQERRNAVIYFHDGERVTIIASKMGLPENPAWYYNARANPDVLLGGEPFRVEEIEDDVERERIWELADRVFPPYATYRRRTARAGRRIPILQLVASRQS